MATHTRPRTFTARLGAPTITPAAVQAPVAEALPEGSADHYAGSQIARHEGRDRAPRSRPDGGDAVPGMDVSGHQGDVDRARSWADGARFAYVKATEGTGYRNPDFARQHIGSHDVGMIRGAYHFALPDRSDGAARAEFFASDGGAWSPDGRTPPGALDMECNPYGDVCHGPGQAAMGAWVRAFSDRPRQRTGRHPTICTSTNWWNRCVGDADRFGGTTRCGWRTAPRCSARCRAGGITGRSGSGGRPGRSPATGTCSTATPGNWRGSPWGSRRCSVFVTNSHELWRIG